MPAINPVQRFIVRGLQPQFEPHLVARLVIFTQQIQHCIRHAVRACADAQPNDAGLADRLLIHRTQHLHFRPGAGIRLKISEVAFCAVNQLRLIRQLFCDGVILLGFVGKRGHITKSAATPPDGAIPVRTAKPAVQRQFMDFLPITAGKIATKHID